MLRRAAIPLLSLPSHPLLRSTPFLPARHSHHTAHQLQHFNTKDAPLPIGPYSQAVKVNGVLYVSGALGFDDKIGGLISDDVTAQTKKAMENIGVLLKAANSSFDQVAKTTILLADMNDFQTVNAIYGSYFKPGQYPARACYAVKTLPLNARVEIETIAVHN